MQTVEANKFSPNCNINRNRANSDLVGTVSQKLEEHEEKNRCDSHDSKSSVEFICNHDENKNIEKTHEQVARFNENNSPVNNNEEIENTTLDYAKTFEEAAMDGLKTGAGALLTVGCAVGGGMVGGVVGAFALPLIVTGLCEYADKTSNPLPVLAFIGSAIAFCAYYEDDSYEAYMNLNYKLMKLGGLVGAVAGGVKGFDLANNKLNLFQNN